MIARLVLGRLCRNNKHRTLSNRGVPMTVYIYELYPSLNRAGGGAVANPSLEYSSHLSNQIHTMAVGQGCVRRLTLAFRHLHMERQRIPGCRSHHCQFHTSHQKMVDTGRSVGSENKSTPSPPPARPSSPSMPPMPPRKRPIKKAESFMFQKFFTFVQGYQQMMERRFPQAMHVSRVFFVGVKEFSKELAEYVKIKTKALLSSDGVLQLNRNDLDIYYRMPTEIVRVGPTLLLSALPGCQYIIFPIAYKFPKRLLSSHFWSLQQKSQFAIENQKRRLLNQRPVLRQLQSSVDSISDDRLLEMCREMLFKLGSGMQPSIREIMKIKPLFESHPFSIKAMHGPHVKALCRLHGLHTWFFNRSRLFDRAEMLYVMDLSLIREGIFTLSQEEIRSACFMRGLNAANTSQEDMVEFLQQWASVSSSIQPHSYSLLLHLPVLIAYNNPNNWALLSS